MLTIRMALASGYNRCGGDNSCDLIGLIVAAKDNGDFEPGTFRGGV